jgi:pimeloyl-ACP methyl ester carboxylesterase
LFRSAGTVVAGEAIHLLAIPLRDRIALGWARTASLSGKIEVGSRDAKNRPRWDQHLLRSSWQQAAAVVDPWLMDRCARDTAERIEREGLAVLKSAASDYMAAKIPGAQKVVIPAAGHAVNIDQPQAFIAAVLPFLDSLDARTVKVAS